MADRFSVRHVVALGVAALVGLSLALFGAAGPAVADATFSVSGHISLGTPTMPAGANEVRVHAMPAATPWASDVWAPTDASGAYTIAGLAPGSYAIWVEYVGTAHYSSRYLDGHYDVGTSVPVTVTSNSVGNDATLPLRAAVSGTVSFGSAGNHPAGAIARVTTNPNNVSWPDAALTDANGHFTLWLNPGSYVIAVLPQVTGYQDQYWHDGDPVSGRGTGLIVGATPIAGIDQTLPPTGTISGHVWLGSTEKSAAAGQVKVTLYNPYSSGGEPTALTNASGDYEFSGVMDGSYTLGFVDVGDSEFQPLSGIATSVGRTALQPRAPDATLASSGSIVGQVFLGDVSHPAGAGTVHVAFLGPNSDGSLPSFVAATDATGHYAITGLTAGAYTLFFHYSGTEAFADEYWSNTFAYGAATPTTVTTAPITRDVILPATGSITGHLINPKGSFENAYVFARSTDVLGSASADVQVTTNSDGTFTLPRLAPGTYQLWFEDTDFSLLPDQWYHQTPGSAHGQSIVVTAGSSRNLGNIPLTQGAGVSGRVNCLGSCTFSGAIDAGFELDGRDSPTSPWVPIRSDYTYPDGFSTFAPVPGEYRITFTGPIGFSCAPADSGAFTVTDGQSLVLPTLTMQCGPVPGGFGSLSSYRVLDTRRGIGAAARPVAPGGVVSVQVAGVGGVPSSNVSAVVLNLTVAGSSGAGFVTAYASGASRPTASNVNFLPLQVVPNLVVVPVGADGRVDLYNGSPGPTDLVADVEGYYMSGARIAAGTFGSLPPARLLDTRSGLGAAKGAVAPGGVVALQVDGQSGVPSSGVSAVVLNVTVAGSSGSGYVTAYGSGTTRPTASNLNFSPGQVVPNLVVVPVGTDGKVDLYNGSSGTTQLVADVSGYYTSGDPQEQGAFGSVAPFRLLDTRSGVGAPAGAVPPGGVVAVQVTGRGGVPTSKVSAVVLNVTVAGSSAAGFITAYGSGMGRPTASNLNFLASQVVPNLVVVPVGGDGQIDLYNSSSGSTQLVADVAGYYLTG